ncbi:hypothetical protein FE251_14805 [Georgenia wutianyii]|uniref:DUF3618 domain-containing protein n=1 Tax=Georgenia wutianyii TaxID=2585135 RepID=A0ABX5VSG6_9MICO|nr:hypothetical protein [Georgenia wutianyii]QDB80498.1 hypothetical protein FE251_14805 [Georgenia wutianyii]
MSTTPVESGRHSGGGTKEAAKEEASKVAGSAKDEAAQVAGNAKDQAAQVAGNAKDQATQVAGTAKEEAQRAVGEARRQAQTLLHEGQTELSTQAGTQQERLAQGLRAFSAEMGQLAEGAEEPGMATHLARWAAETTGDAGRWLEGREPSAVLAEVRSYARRSPGTFVLIAGGLGLAVGRIARSLKDTGDDEPAGGYDTSPTATTASLPPTGSPVGYGTATPTGTTPDARPPGLTYGTDEPGGLR